MRPIHPAPSFVPILAAALLVAADAFAAGPSRAVDPTPLEVVLEKWSHAHRGRKAAEALSAIELRVAEEVEAYRPRGEAEDRRLAGLRRIAGALSWPGAPKETGRFKGRDAKAKGPAGPRAFPLPKQVLYRFGDRELIAVDPKNRALQAALKRRRPPAVDDLEEVVRLEALLEGTLPEAELAIAEIQRRLDVDPTADLYARFLESWRNWGPYGEESFYEALDRTAGTPEEVFFYDAMLSEFVGRFAPEVGKRWSLQKQHDTNQQAFLSYRQYRGLIEAVSFVLVAPPDVALPERLARYDYDSVAPGLFSLRHQVDLLVEFAGGDVERVVDDLRAFLERQPMPDDLWSGYDPMGPLAEEFRGKVSRQVAGTGRSADGLFERQRAERLALAEAIRAAASRALGG